MSVSQEVMGLRSAMCRDSCRTHCVLGVPWTTPSRHPQHNYEVVTLTPSITQYQLLLPV